MLSDFLKNHIVGMIIFAIVTSVAGSYVWRELTTSVEPGPEIVGKWVVRTSNVKEPDGGTVSGEVIFYSDRRADIIYSGSRTDGHWNYDPENRKIMLFDDAKAFTATLMWSRNNPRLLSGRDHSGDTWILTRAPASN